MRSNNQVRNHNNQAEIVNQRENIHNFNINQVLFFKPYKSFNELASHISEHFMVLTIAVFVWLLPIIAFAMPVVWFFLCMRAQPDLANTIMQNLIYKLMVDFLQLLTVPYRCAATLILGFSENNLIQNNARQNNNNVR